MSRMEALEFVSSLGYASLREYVLHLAEKYKKGLVSVRYICYNYGTDAVNEWDSIIKNMKGEGYAD